MEDRPEWYADREEKLKRIIHAEHNALNHCEHDNITGSTIYVYPGTVAPANWQQYRWAVLPAGTTTTTLLGLTASTNYVVGVAFFDAISQVRGTMATATTFQTTNSTSGTADRPAGFSIIDGVNDATLPQGVALGLWASAGADYIVIERAGNAVSGVVDYPGTYAELAIVPASTEVYIDSLPRNGTKYWYRIKERRDGQADSDYIPKRLFVNVGNTVYAGLQAVATGIPTDVIRPAASEAVITPTSLYDEAGQSIAKSFGKNESQRGLTKCNRCHARSWCNLWSSKDQRLQPVCSNGRCH